MVLAGYYAKGWKKGFTNEKGVLLVMIEGVCPNCGERSYGWALLRPRNQSCTKCGTGLLLTEDGKKTIQGYSPFTAEEYKIKLPLEPPLTRIKPGETP